MHILPRLDPEVEAKAFATLLGTIVVGGAKWLWEEAKKRGRRGEKVPSYIRVEQLEGELAKEKVRAEYAEREAFDIRDRWSERSSAHTMKQARMYQRMKTAEGRARILGADLIDARKEIEDLKDEIVRMAYEPRHQRPTPSPDRASEG